MAPPLHALPFVKGRHTAGLVRVATGQSEPIKSLVFLAFGELTRKQGHEDTATGTFCVSQMHQSAPASTPMAKADGIGKVNARIDMGIQVRIHTGS
jgi:hypothetical protein